ncbi:hypothetical protein SASPL_136227 [Salvia splendens]|uniref:Uncharacterized protein n=1 Tax=Salvia splendens TaxID=180675 RepID=A0A8X8ZGP0_SALSN|nr:hypothetical protein SASPL_136227 [Salvia splendens]
MVSSNPYKRDSWISESETLFKSLKLYQDVEVYSTRIGRECGVIVICGKGGKRADVVIVYGSIDQPNGGVIYVVVVVVVVGGAGDVVKDDAAGGRSAVGITSRIRVQTGNNLECSVTTTSRRTHALFPAGIPPERMSTGLRATPSPLGISSRSRNGHSDSRIALAKARTRVGLRQNRTSSRFCM